MAKEEVEALFHQVLQNTEELQNALEKASVSQAVVDEVVLKVNEREALILRLFELLQNESNPEQYRMYYERCRELEASVVQKLTSAKETLSHKIIEAKHNKQANKKYDSYLRLMPYGAFIDDKK